MKQNEKPGGVRKANPSPREIVEAYQKILKDRDKFGVAMPVSMLPYSKTQIKAAILSLFPDIQGSQEKQALRTNYITLAEFIPDQMLEAIGDDWARAADAECDEDKQGKATEEAEVMEEVVRIQKGIADEGAALLKEIDAFLTRL